VTTPFELGVFGVVAFALWLAVMRTEPGRRLRGWVGSRMMKASSARSASPRGTTTSEDHRFLLDRCNGNEAELLRRLETEIRRHPGLDETEAYRKAIRSWFLEKRGGTHGAIADDLDDTWL
jgi:hypothetical protein